MPPETPTSPDEITFLDLAEKVLLEAKKPMTYREIWDYAVSHRYDSMVGSHGRTPWISVSAQLGTDVKRANSRFVRTELFPARWYLRSLPPPAPSSATPSTALPDAEVDAEDELTERDYHPLVAIFANMKWSAHVKTILHEISKRRGYLKWAHPDLVGFSFEDKWEDPIIDLGTMVGSPPVVFLSFEVKRSLDFDNLGEAFFEAVSNSSWAHRGYLAVANIDEDPDFRAELSRLAGAHGIGVIELDPGNPEDSRVLIEARQRPDLDWATVNKLYDVNKDFSDFIDAVRKVIKSGGGIRKEDYDSIPDDQKALVARLAKDSSTAPPPPSKAPQGQSTKVIPIAAKAGRPVKATEQAPPSKAPPRDSKNGLST